MNQQIGINLGSIPMELRVILELLKRDNERNIELNRKQWFKDIDWSLFLELANHHRVYPVLYPKLKNLAEVPKHVTQSLFLQYRSNTFRMLQLSAEMEELSYLFIKNEIR